MIDAVRPNFFIVGAPKSGTTSLFDYLSGHPSVCVPTRKEPHFFARDLYAPHYVRDQGAYQHLFRNWADEPAVGEASVYYLYSQEAASAISAYRPDARIVAMLRNPVDMIYSLHSQRLFGGYEDIADFAQALDAESDRKEGRRLPANGHPFQCLQYRDVGRYAEQLKRLQAVFPPEQVKVILFDDFTADTAATFASVCRFLAVDDTYQPDLVVHNPNKTVRSETVRSILRFSAAPRTLARTLLPLPLRRKFKRGLLRANTRYETRAPMPADLRARLQDHFRDEIQEVAELLGRDLGHWTARVPDAAGAHLSSGGM